MSRRKLQWKRNANKAGDVNKIIPVAAKGKGLWLTKEEIEGKNRVAPGTGEGTTCTAPISERKEKLVRQWCK